MSTDTVLEMLQERLAGRPPHLPPPTRAEEAPEPVVMRLWAAHITPKGGVSQRVDIEASCPEDAYTKARALGKLLHGSSGAFTYSVRRAG